MKVTHKSVAWIPIWFALYLLLSVWVVDLVLWLLHRPTYFGRFICYIWECESHESKE
jgi:hypothetical protein